MRSAVTVIAIVLVGLFAATSIGYAAYVVSRDSVGLPVTKLKRAPGAPKPVKRPPRTVVRPPPPPPPARTTTTSRTTTEPGDDHGGDSGNSGKGSSGSGGSGRGRGGDDDD
jgi:uncharacterized membrane protein YgcG